VKKMEVRIAKLHENKIDEYERLHREMPEAIKRNMMQAGISDLRIYRDGVWLLMIVKREERPIASDGEIDETTEREWQKETGECFAGFWREAGLVYEYQVKIENPD